MDKSQLYGTSIMAGWGLFCALVMFILPIVVVYQITSIRGGITTAHHLTPARSQEVTLILFKVSIISYSARYCEY